MKQFLAIALTMVLLLTGSVLQAQCNFQVSTINEDFDAIPDGQRPACWYAHNTSIPGGSGNFVHLGEYWMWKYAAAAQTEMFMVVMRNSTVKGPLNFDLKKYPSGGYLTFEVGTVSNPNDPNTFTNFQSISHNSDVPLPCLVDFSSYAGTNKYIAFRCYIANNQGFSFDNVTFTGPPTSIMPERSVGP